MLKFGQERRFDLATLDDSLKASIFSLKQAKSGKKI